MATCQEPPACSVRIWFPEYHSGLPIRTWPTDGKSIQRHSQYPPARCKEIWDEMPLPRRSAWYAGRFDVAQAVQNPGAAFPSGASGFLQHLQAPQLWPSHKLPEFSSIRPIDSDAGSIAGKWRPEWRPQSAASNRRTALGATGGQDSLLTTTTRAFLLRLAPMRFRPLSYDPFTDIVGRTIGQFLSSGFRCGLNASESRESQSDRRR